MTEPEPTTLPDDYVRPKKRSEGRYRNSAWIPALFLSLACIGWLFPWHEEPPTPKDCTAVERRAEVNPDAYAALLARGYQAEGNALIPPGCESAR